MKKSLLFVFMFFVLSCSTACAGVTEDLYNAVKNKNITPAGIKALVKFGADVNYKDPEGVSVLMNAILNGSSYEVIKWTDEYLREQYEGLK